EGPTTTSLASLSDRMCCEAPLQGGRPVAGHAGPTAPTPPGCLTHGTAACNFPAISLDGVSAASEPTPQSEVVVEVVHLLVVARSRVVEETHAGLPVPRRVGRDLLVVGRPRDRAVLARGMQARVDVGGEVELAGVAGLPEPVAADQRFPRG